MAKFLERASFDWSEDSIRFINTPSPKAKSTFFYMQEAGYFKTTPPYFTERAGLPSFLIVYTLSGKGILHYGDDEYTLSNGQCFFINCMNHHDYETPPAESWEFLWVHFYGSSSIGYYQEFERNGFSILDIRNKSRFEEMLWQIISINQKKLVSRELLTSHLILGLLTELLLLRSEGLYDNSILPDYVSGCMKYIDTHFKEELSLSFLADTQHVSKYYLSREFKHYVGITLQDYLINTRITYAKEQLKYTNASVNDIAFSCGIPNVSHFIRLFKTRENLTPLAWRKQWHVQ